MSILLVLCLGCGCLIEYQTADSAVGSDSAEYTKEHDHTKPVDPGHIIMPEDIHAFCLGEWLVVERAIICQVDLSVVEGVAVLHKCRASRPPGT